MSFTLKVFSATTGFAASALLSHHHHNSQVQTPTYTDLKTTTNQNSTLNDEVTTQGQSSTLNDLQTPMVIDDLSPPGHGAADSPQSKQLEMFKRAVVSSRELAVTKLYESGSPGMVVAVAVNGKTVWRHGFGYADVENRVLANPNTVMRIASISKSITMAAVAKLMESGKLDLDKPITDYVKAWPSTQPTITARQLVSHMAGVRHYQKKEEIDEMNGKKAGNSNGDGRFKEFHIKDKFDSVEKALELFKNDELLAKPGEAFYYTTHGFTLLSAVVEAAAGEPFEKHMKRTFRDLGLRNTFLDENDTIINNRARYYIRNHRHQLQNAPYVDNSCKWAGGGFLSNVQDLLKFGNAMLYSYQYKPNSKSAAGSSTVLATPTTVSHTSVVFQDNDSLSGLDASLLSTTKSAYSLSSSNEMETKLPSDIPILNEAKSTSSPVDINTSDIAYKPGPFSAVNQQQQSSKPLSGFLKSETVQQLWTPVIRMAPEDSLNDGMYGMGWQVNPRFESPAFSREEPFSALHTGGAVGASSVLLIMPVEDKSAAQSNQLPRGVVVAILCNMQGVSLTELAQGIAREFEGVKPGGPYRVQKIYQC